MKGLAYRKLSRTSSHRDALLRNLVTSLIQHQRISTTYAKAKEAQRMAERIITKAKKAFLDEHVQQKKKAIGYVYDRSNTVPQLEELARRFADRQGGYTRLHLHGNRHGDHAPRALLEFVDQPRGDLKLELTAMTMGREMFLRVLKQAGGAVGAEDAAIQQEAAALGSIPAEHDERFEPLTRKNAHKVLLHGGEPARALLQQKAREQFFRLMAMRQVDGDHRVDEERVTKLDYNRPRGDSSSTTLPMKGRRRLAGMQRDALQSGPAEPALKHPFAKKNSVIRIGKGAFARSRTTRARLIPSSVQLATQKLARMELAKDKFVP